MLSTIMLLIKVASNQSGVIATYHISFSIVLTYKTILDMPDSLCQNHILTTIQSYNATRFNATQYEYVLES